MTSPPFAGSQDLPLISSEPRLQRPSGTVLVLTRKKNESICISDNIVVTVVEIRSDKVRLGIEAPRDVPVHRREIYEKIKQSEGLKETKQEKSPSRE